MSKIEAIEAFAKAVFNDKNKIITTDEFNELISKAETQQEREFYVNVYSYLLQKRQKEVVDSGTF